MTKDQIKESIASNELQLTFWEKITHYNLTIGSIITALLLIVFYILKPETIGSIIKELLFIEGVFLCMGIYYFFEKRNRLQFSTVQSRLPQEQIAELITKIAVESDWNITINQPEIIVANSKFSFSANTWGERITVLINGDTVFVNSINDPDKRSSVTKGRNKKNIATIVSEIEKAGEQNFIENKVIGYEYKQH